MFVSSIYDELQRSEVLGTCDQATIFSRLTDAVSLISNQGILDPNIGEMELCVCDGCVTLPREVGTILAANQAGLPTLMRDQWYQYSVNGTGSWTCPSYSYTDVIANNTPTIRDPAGPVALVASITSPLDSNKMLRVFGWDSNGKRIYTASDANGTLQDGFLVPCVYGFSEPNPSAPLIQRIDRIQKDVTNGPVQLLAVNADGSSNTLIGSYQPDETVPSYVRLKVPCNNWLRIKYRRRDLQVRTVNDWINIENREVIILAVKAVNYRRKNNVELAGQLEAEAVRLLNNEANAKRPPAVNAPQIIMDVWPPSSGMEYGMFY